MKSERKKSQKQNLGRKAIRKNLPMQLGDVKETFADISRIQELYGYEPTTTIKQGIPQFIQWYQSYYDCGYEVEPIAC